MQNSKSHNSINSRAHKKADGEERTTKLVFERRGTSCDTGIMPSKVKNGRNFAAKNQSVDEKRF